MASMATVSVVWIGFRSVASAVGRDGSTLVSFSITASTNCNGTFGTHF
jgi:hypothetical protein